MQDFIFLTEIPVEEQKKFDSYIQAARKEFILDPKETVKRVLAEHSDLMEALKDRKDVSSVVKALR